MCVHMSLHVRVRMCVCVSLCVCILCSYFWRFLLLNTLCIHTSTFSRFSKATFMHVQLLIIISSSITFCCQWLRISSSITPENTIFSFIMHLYATCIATYIELAIMVSVICTVIYWTMLQVLQLSQPLCWSLNYLLE